MHTTAHGGWKKAFTAFKKFCFREQFKLKKYELNSIKRIYIFVVTIDVEMWFSVSSSCNAPHNDKCLKKTLEIV